MRYRSLIIAAFIAASVTSPAAGELDLYRFDGVERTVAFGDVHGALDQLMRLLNAAGVIDTDGSWAAGRTHLVSTGDLLSRGDDERQVLDLLMRLEREAEAAGGRVHVLLGNHEVMALTGDLRFVSAGGYASFGGEEARRAAFAPTGSYGRWLLQKPLMVVVNDTLFLHGGLSRSLQGMTLDGVNHAAMRDIRTVVDALHSQRATGGAEYLEGSARVRTDDPDVQQALRGLPFQSHGPLWYRGTSWCDPASETEIVAAVLNDLGAARVAVGHTVTDDRRIVSRMAGRVFRMDTGMNVRAYDGRAMVLVMHGDETYAIDAVDGRVEVQHETEVRPLDTTQRQAIGCSG